MVTICIGCIESFHQLQQHNHNAKVQLVGSGNSTYSRTAGANSPEELKY